MRVAQADEAEMRYRAARELYDQKQYSEALNILQDAAVRFPEDRRIRSLLGKAEGAVAKQREREEKARRREIAAHLDNAHRAVRRSEFEQARAAYQAILTLDPESKEAKTGLTKLAKAEEDAKLAEQERARIDAAEQAARLAEEERRKMVDTARRLAADGDYAGAVELLEEARRKAPQDAEVAKYLERYRREQTETAVDERVSRASALLKEDRHQEALEELRAALALDPDNRGLQRRIAKVEDEIEDAANRAAREEEERAEKEREETVRAARDLAGRKDYAGAIALLEKAQAQAPDDPEIAKYLERYRKEQVEEKVQLHIAAADALTKDGRYDDAIAELQAALALDPGDSSLRSRMAKVEGEKARQASREAATREEETRKADEAEMAERRKTEQETAAKVQEHLRRAETMMAGGEFDGAREELASVRELQPDNAEAARLEKEIDKRAAEAEQTSEAKAREERRRQMQHEVQERLSSAEELIDQGKYDEARAELARVRELQPNNRVAERLEREARLKEQAGETAAEREARAKALAQKEEQARKLVGDARQALRKGDYDNAMNLAGEAAKLDPRNDDAVAVAREAAAKKLEVDRKAEVERVREEIDRRLAEARTYLDHGEYDAAIEVTKQVLLIEEANQDARKIREQAEAAKGRAEAAMNQNEAQGHYERARVLFDQNEWDAAEEELRQALALYPAHTDSKRLLDRVAETRSREAKALAEEQKKREAEEQKLRLTSAQEAFAEGQALYEQGDIIGAWEAWERAVQMDPAFEAPRMFMDQTEADYQRALAIREEEERARAEDAKWQAKLDQVIGSFEIPEPTQIETVLTSILGVLSGFNFIVGEGVTGEVELRISDKTLREILDLLLLPNGFSWRREGDTILVTTKFRSRVFPLSPEEYKKVKQILEHPEELENPNLDLRRIIYGERDPQEIPGRELRLNAKTQTLIVRDSEANIGKVEAWLQQLEDIVLAREPNIYRSYVLDPEIKKTVYDMVRRFLVEEAAGDEVTHREEGKRLIFDEQNGILVILDTPQNLEHVEEIILREDIMAKLKQGVLKARVFRITEDTGMDPEAVFRRLEVIRGVVEILRTMLYEGTGETEEEANARGRRIFYPESRDQELRDPRFIGTITVVDTDDNLRKVQDFLGTVGGTGTRNFYVISVKHRDIRDLKLQLDRATGRVRDVGTQAGYGYYGTDIERQLQVRALIVEDPETHSLIIRADDPTVMDEIQTVVELLDKAVAQVEIESRLIQVSVDDIRSVGLDWTFTQIGESGINWSDNVNALNLITDAATSVGATYRTIGPTQLSLVLNLISTLDSAEVLSAPKITVVSSPPDPATIEVITEEPVVTSIDLDTKGDDDPRNDTYRPNFETDEVGITLEVTPTVLGDGYVIMDISPEVSTVVGRVPIVAETGEVGGLGGLSLEQLGPLIIDTSSATTRVRVKDGDTIVIGGLVRDQLTRSINAVPILGHLPLLGALFRDEGTNITKETLLIFVTVHVVPSE